MSDNAREIFRSNLNRIMHERHIEQSDIVSALHLTAFTVSDWVNGKKYPRVDRMQQLADFLGVKMSDLTAETTDESARILQISQSLHENPRLGLLFDRSSEMTEKDMDAVLGVVEAILKERDGYD